MKNKIMFLFLIVFLFLLIPNFCNAKEKNRIEEYNITINPRNNGSLDIIYSFKWKVLNSDEGLTWILIPISNANVDSVQALTDNIKSIRYYDEYGDSIKVNFAKTYYSGDVIEFKFSIHQSYMYSIDDETCAYEFVPGIFENIYIKKMKVTWNSKNVFSSNAKSRDLNNNLLWEKSLRPGKNLDIKVVYQKNVFILDYDMQVPNATYTDRIITDYSVDYIDISIEVVIAVICMWLVYVLLGLDYKFHGGFGYRKNSYYESIK